MSLAHGVGALQGVKIVEIASDAVVDCSNFEGVLFIGSFDTPGAGNSLQGRQGEASDGSDQANLSSSLVTTASSEDVAVLQIHKPRESQGAFVSVTKTGAGDMVAVLYGSRNSEVVQDAGETVALNSISPALA